MSVDEHITETRQAYNAYREQGGRKRYVEWLEHKNYELYLFAEITANDGAKLRVKLIRRDAQNAYLKRKLKDNGITFAERGTA